MRQRLALDALLVALIALGITRALRQEAIYGDGSGLLSLRAQGMLEYQGHQLYMPCIALLQRLLAPLGWSLFEIESFASSLGTSLGIGFLFLAALSFGVSRSRSWLLSACVIATPAIAFYASVIEIHGVFLAPVGLSFWIAGHLATRPTSRTNLAVAAGLGTVTAVSALVHTTGHILPVCILPLVYAVRRERAALTLRAVVLETASLAALHFAIYAAVFQWLHPVSANAPFLDRARYLLSGLERIDLQAWPTSAWNEFGFAFLPLSILWPIAFLRPALRVQALGFLGSWLAYQMVPFVLLGDTTNEHGAYLVPLAFPAALLVVRSAREWILVLTICIGAIAAIGQVRDHDRLAKDWPSAAEVAEFTARGTRIFVVATTAEFAPVLKHEPSTLPVPLDQLLLANPSDEQIVSGFVSTCEVMRRTGREILVTDVALRSLREDPRRQLRLLKDAVMARYGLERIAVSDLLAWRLVPK